MASAKRLIKRIPGVSAAVTITAPYRGYVRTMRQRFVPQLYVDFRDFNIGEIEINNTCNLDCIICRSSLSQRPRRTMALDLFEHCVEQEKRFGSGHTTLHTIGEPLMNANLDKYLEVLRTHKIDITLSTNVLLMAKRMPILFEYGDVIRSIRFSIDGATKATYERLRTPGKFSALIENLELFLSENQKTEVFKDIRIGSVVSTDVMHELAYHLKFYSRYARMRNISLVLMSGLCPDNQYFLENSVLKNHIVPWRPCEQLFQPVLHVLNDGSVTACCRDYHGELVFGNINDSPVEQLINNEAIRGLRQQHLDDSISTDMLCHDCYRVDPRVQGLFSMFVDRLVTKYESRWDVDEMQERFDQFFDCFNTRIPTRREFLRLMR